MTVHVGMMCMNHVKTPKKNFFEFIDCLHVYDCLLSFPLSLRSLSCSVTRRIACLIHTDDVFYAHEQAMIERQQQMGKHQLAEKKKIDVKKVVKIINELNFFPSTTALFTILYHLPENSFDNSLFVCSNE